MIKKIFIFSAWLLPILYMILIWVLSGLPHNAVVELPNSQFDRIWKESMHLVEFALLYLLLIIALAASGKLTHGTSLLVALLSGLYGITDEIHQSFVPYRSATMIDVIKDWIGVLAAWGHIRYHHFNRQKSFITKIEYKLTE